MVVVLVRALAGEDELEVVYAQGADAIPHAVGRGDEGNIEWNILGR